MVLLVEMLIWYDFHVNWFYLLGQQVPVDLFCEMGLICKSLHCIMLLFVRLWEKTRLVWRMKKVPWMMGKLNTDYIRQDKCQWSSIRKINKSWVQITYFTPADLLTSQNLLMTPSPYNINNCIEMFYFLTGIKPVYFQ